MPFKKGHKLSGSRKGKPNKVTVELKEFCAKLVDANRDQMQDALDKLKTADPYHYLMALDKIMSKVIANKKDITSDDQSIVPNVTIIERRNSTEPEAGGGD